MPIRLSNYTITGSTLTYTTQAVSERDKQYGDIPRTATMQGETVTVDVAAPPPEMDILL